MALLNLPRELLRKIPSSAASLLMRKNILRQNRKDPRKEFESRKGETIIPVNEINNKWWDHPLGGRIAHTNVVQHYNIFKDVLKCDPYFTDTPPFTVSYPSQTLGNANISVDIGNLILPGRAQDPPITFIDWDRIDTRLVSIILTNPDGYVFDNNYEIIHWMQLNIEKDQQINSKLTPIYEYLQPLPFKGTGLHRLVFLLIKHSEPLIIPRPDEEYDGNLYSELENRWFSTEFLWKCNSISCKDQIYTRFFQTIWDKSVSRCMIEKLKIAEPIYSLYNKLSEKDLNIIASKYIKDQQFKIDTSGKIKTKITDISQIGDTKYTI